jgi:hypothetical protein
MRAYVILVLLFSCTGDIGCSPPASTEDVTLVITNPIIDGWYVIAEDRADGSEPVRHGNETIITFDENNVAKVKGHPFSGKWIKYKFLHQPTKSIIRSIDEVDSNERASKNVGHRQDDTIWFRIGKSSEQQSEKGQVVKLGEFSYTNP